MLDARFSMPDVGFLDSRCRAQIAKTVWNTAFSYFCNSCFCAGGGKSFGCIAMRFVETPQTRFGPAIIASSTWGEMRNVLLLIHLRKCASAINELRCAHWRNRNRGGVSR